jgi:methylenetetrahydrofolate dehydrogenase (NADP+)/methenyltetrahydrofolate cyclohydrolase/formyltetrahydrofolate synthetase
MYFVFCNKRSLRQQMTETVSKMRSLYGMVPHLAIIQVGDREDSSVYVRMKQNAALKVELITDQRLELTFR